LGSTAGKIERSLSGLAVIVLGVLLALWAEAAWAERGSRLREREVVSDLLAEFRGNEVLLRADIENNPRTKEAGADWAAALLGATALPPDSVTALWLLSQDWSRFDPVSGVLLSLVDGGSLNLIQDDELRQALAGWEGRADEARNTSQDMTVELAGLRTMVLSIRPGAALTAGERAAVIYSASFSEGSLSQMIPLLGHLRQIISLLEAQLEP